MFGRIKSEKSTSEKKASNIQDYDDKFQTAIEEQKDIPTEVRPIFDFYAYKLVCPEITNSHDVINTVISDILTDIGKHSPKYLSYITELKSSIDISRFPSLEFITNNFSDKYPNLKDKLAAVMYTQNEANKTQEFLDNAPKDVSNLTYSEYYSKIIECYQLLINLSYDDSIEEYTRIAKLAKQSREQLHQIIEQGKSHQKIDKQFHKEYGDTLEKLLKHVSKKRTNRLDLTICDLMVFDVLTTCESLKKLGVSYSKDPTRTKKKRKQNGYIANFYSLDMPNGLTSEIQLQSLYRYEYGEYGPAAHHKMENGLKKRTLFKRPKNKSKYADWAEKQFKALPRYFTYRGNGYVEVHSTLQNFRKYYDCKDKSEVQTYVEFIAQHDVDLLDSHLIQFSLDDTSPLNKSTKANNSAEER
ncbi:MAG: hypothetical protein IKF83_00540 [Clostridia bacterium]|nr:hypothetical protein [Clostridia bacterium]